MKIHLKILTIITGALVALSLSGCGKSENTSAGPAAAPASSGQTAATKDGRAIEITGNDTMKFNLSEIRATPGEALALTLNNVGTMPKFSMGHNWVLLAADVDVNAFVNDASTAVKQDYVPAAYKDRIIAATKLLGPRESDTIYFKAPTKPGRYVFVCSFPGHYQVGMKGELIVE